MDAYLGEIRTVGFNFAPINWALCNGQLLAISSNTALFSILGTYFGGDGRSNFGLPNLQAASPLGAGNGSGLSQRVLGETGGENAVTLLSNQMTAHNHGVGCINGAGNSGSPANAVWAKDGAGRGVNLYAAAANLIGMNGTAVQISGNNQPHNNRPPFLGLYFIICVSGIYPPRG